jgi:hypothetical protein
MNEFRRRILQSKRVTELTGTEENLIGFQAEYS